jgi:hypothetical protein
MRTISPTACALRPRTSIAAKRLVSNSAHAARNCTRCGERVEDDHVTHRQRTHRAHECIKVFVRLETVGLRDVCACSRQ